MSLARTARIARLTPRGVFTGSAGRTAPHKECRGVVLARFQNSVQRCGPTLVELVRTIPGREHAHASVTSTITPPTIDEVALLRAET